MPSERALTEAVAANLGIPAEDIEANGLTQDQIKTGLLPLLTALGASSSIRSVTTDPKYANTVGQQQFDFYLNTRVPMIAVTTGTGTINGHAIFDQGQSNGTVLTIDPGYYEDHAKQGTVTYDDAWTEMKKGGPFAPGYIVVPSSTPRH